MSDQLSATVSYAIDGLQRYAVGRSYRRRKSGNMFDGIDPSCFCIVGPFSAFV